MTTHTTSIHWLDSSEARNIRNAAREAKEAGDEMALAALVLPRRLESKRARLAAISDELLAIAAELSTEVAEES